MGDDPVRAECMREVLTGYPRVIYGNKMITAPFKYFVESSLSCLRRSERYG